MEQFTDQTISQHQQGAQGASKLAEADAEDSQQPTIAIPQHIPSNLSNSSNSNTSGNAQASRSGDDIPAFQPKNDRPKPRRRQAEVEGTRYVESGEIEVSALRDAVQGEADAQANAHANAQQPRSFAPKVSAQKDDHGKQRKFSPTETMLQPLWFTNAPFTDTASKERPAHQRYPKWRIAYGAAVVVTDIVVMLLALALAFAIKPTAYDTLVQYMPVVLFAVAQCGLWVLCLAITGTYHGHIISEGYGLYSRIINSMLLTIVASCCLLFILSIPLPLTAVVLAPFFACLLELVARWQLRRLLHSNRRKGECMWNTVIVGSPEGITRTLRSLKETPGLGYRPVAICPIANNVEDGETDDETVIAVPYQAPDDLPEAAKLRVVAFNSHFPRTAERLNARAVLVADVLSRDSELLHALSLAVESLGIELAVTVSLADMSSHRLEVRNTGEEPILTARLPQYGPITRFLKRTMDIIGSIIAIIISGPLIMLPVAIAVKLEDGGPVIYKQERIGRNGVPFKCLKFRSMRVDADKMDAQLAAQNGVELGALFKVKDDPRVTKVGKFIRKYSLDEFPQFFNVLKGDMSLVGPRPQRQYEVDAYGMLYSTRLLVRPGVTGPWQVSGRSDLSQNEAERLDVSYIENWSITGDLVLLAKTVVAVVRGSGAY